MSASCPALQQVAFLDTKFSAQRLVDAPHYRLTYLRWRQQLLAARQGTGHSEGEAVGRGEAYLAHRARLLAAHCLAQSDILPPPTRSGRADQTRGLSQESQARAGPAYDFRGLQHVSDLHRAAVTSLKFLHNSPDRLVAASMDGNISIHCLSSHPPAVTTQLPDAHKGGVTDFDLSTSNELLVSCGTDGTVCLWCVGTGGLLRRTTPAPCHALAACRFIPGNNNLVVTAGRAGTVTTINISTGTTPAGGSSRVGGAVTSLATGPAPLLWCGTHTSTVLAFTVTGQGRLAKGRRTIVWNGALGGAVTSLSCQPALPAPLLLVNCAGSQCLLLFTVSDPLGGLTPHRTFPLAHSRLNLRSTFAPLLSSAAATTVVSAAEDGGVHFFNAKRASSSSINTLQAHSCPAIAVAFNHDETYLATSDQSGLLIVWKR